MRFRPGQPQRGRRRFVAGFALALLLAATAATASNRDANASSTQPPIPPPVAPYQPGDQVWYGEAPTVILSPLGSGCQRVPSTGYLATGATARTTGEYSNYWSWSAASAAAFFTRIVALTRSGGAWRPLMGKFSAARAVCTP